MKQIEITGPVAMEPRTRVVVQWGGVLFPAWRDGDRGLLVDLRTFCPKKNGPRFQPDRLPPEVPRWLVKRAAQSRPAGFGFFPEGEAAQGELRLTVPKGGYKR